MIDTISFYDIIILYLVVNQFREVAQLGSALGLGPRGRRFESCLLDHEKLTTSTRCCFFVTPCPSALSCKS